MIGAANYAANVARLLNEYHSPVSTRILKDIDPIVSVIQIGAQDLTVDKTRLKPAIININPLMDEIIKAITWFFVRVERQEVKVIKVVKFVESYALLNDAMADFSKRTNITADTLTNVC